MLKNVFDLSEALYVGKKLLNKIETHFSFDQVESLQSHFVILAK